MINFFDNLEKIRKNARCEFIPIIRDRSLEELIKALNKKKPKKILELGTAIGYSTILISKNLEYEKKIITIEKDENRYKKALENFNLFSVNDVIAKNIDINQYLLSLTNEKFDFVFMDGPKSHYLEYILKLENFLEEGAVIFSDDILYFGLVEKDGKIQKKHRTIVRNLRSFLEYMQTSSKYENILLKEANGILISKYKGKYDK